MLILWYFDTLFPAAYVLVLIQLFDWTWLPKCCIFYNQILRSCLGEPNICLYFSSFSWSVKFVAFNDALLLTRKLSPFDKIRLLIATRLILLHYAVSLLQILRMRHNEAGIDVDLRFGWLSTFSYCVLCSWCLRLHVFVYCTQDECWHYKSRRHGHRKELQNERKLLNLAQTVYGLNKQWRMADHFPCAFVSRFLLPSSRIVNIQTRRSGDVQLDVLCDLRGN